MRFYDIVPINEYSCFNCRKDYESEIVLSFLWFCSESCKFKFAYGLVNKKFPKAKQENKFKLTKKLVEVSLR